MQLSTILGIVQDSAGAGPLLAAIRRLVARRARKHSPGQPQDLASAVTAEVQSDLPIRAISIRVALWQPPS
jgi:hypothetical protein